jgi:membrane fusion protein (multidrug efflux system)
MKRKPLFQKTVLAITLSSGMACQSSEPQANGDAAAEPSLPEVSVAVPSEQPLNIFITAPGSFIAFEEATISTETPGTVAEIRVKEGTRVARGAVLLLLEKTKAELAVQQADAALAQAKANFERAKSELDRKEILLADRTIPQGTFDTFKAQHDSAAAAVEGAESSLALARQRLDDMTIVAPFAGVVKEKKCAVGEYVRPADPLTVIIQVDPLKLQFEVPEKHAARLEVGQEVTTSVTALPGVTFKGKISTVFPSLAVQSRTIHVEALVPNRDYKLIPGFYASVRVPLSPVPNSLVIPRSALFRREGTENVLVLDGDHVDRIPVEVGGVNEDLVEILSGLLPTHRVLVSGVDVLRAGDRVKVKS